ncbi:hydrogenase maturation protease [Micromonospora sp. DR5-3]|uniref:hydrogenase maturation protease n=1 Tax=unclassified Micromonospora TaxID=2617518 RepID=UPI0011D829A2|nr:MULTISPECIES: hydrogenase maturation protease [unclassified Micromonospora]MCW3818540.1 hydrogenase maturation protease [Micromonospora sp. DR5-3]TYC20287.1 hydrogenase maturation protease [Micromonospora sp. MP36]
MSSVDGGRVLVAGIGNIFLGDDAFGVEVVRRLRDVVLPPGVDVSDYGIRGMHLAYDLLDGRHDVLVLVDALPLDEPPGTLAVLQVDLDDPGWSLRPADVLDAPAADAHGMDPESVLRLLRGLGGSVGRVLVVGCRPAVLDECMGLSDPVAAAVDEAVKTVAGIVREETARLAHGEGPAPGSSADGSEREVGTRA